MHTTKSLPTLMLAASLSVGTMLVSQAAFARNNGNNGHHEQHNDRHDRNGMRNEGSGMRSWKSDRSGASQGGIRSPMRTANGRGKWNGSRNTKPPKDPVIAKKPPTPADGKPPFVVTRGGNPPRGPVAAPSTPAKGLPPGTATVSNGRVNLYIPNSAAGLTVTRNPGGTITVSNGDPTRSVTLPGGSVTVSGGGVTSLGGGEGVQIVRHPNGDFAAAGSFSQSAPPKAAGPRPGQVTVVGAAKGGSVGAFVEGWKELGKGVGRGVKKVITVGSPTPGTAGAGGLKTSTTSQY
ncbi:MAG: hypothetical protein ACJ8EF_10740 [Bradyrhizobium sp.]|jgi:hypothetical protein